MSGKVIGRTVQKIRNGLIRNCEKKRKTLSEQRLESRVNGPIELKEHYFTEAIF